MTIWFHTQRKVRNIGEIVLQNDRCALWHGDCLEVMKDIPDHSVDLILCDLPYGTSKCKWDVIIPFDEMWFQYNRITKPNSPIILFGSQPFTAELIHSNIKEFKHEWVWVKSRSGSAITAKYRPVKLHEDVLVFCKNTPTYNPQMTTGEPYYRKPANNKKNDHMFGVISNMETNNLGTRYPITVQHFKQNWSKQQQIHPTQKPVALCEYLIKTYSNPNDFVLDNCMGSGTTGVAALNTNRRFIGIELDPTYCGIAKERIQHVVSDIS